LAYLKQQQGRQQQQQQQQQPEKEPQAEDPCKPLLSSHKARPTLSVQIGLSESFLPIPEKREHRPRRSTVGETNKEDL